MKAWLKGAVAVYRRTNHLGLSYLFTHFRNDGAATSFRTLNGTVTIRNKESDILVFDKIIIQREYDTSRFVQHGRIMKRYREILGDERLPVIIDCGGNIGMSSLWFSTEFPAARVLCVEPNLEAAIIAKSNTAEKKNVIVCEGGVGSTPGLAAENGIGPSWARRTVRSTEGDVRLYSIQDLLQDYTHSGNLFMVKVDIEGFESDLFSTNTSWLDEVYVIFIELHDWMLPGQGSSFAFFDALPKKQFETLIMGETLILIRADSPDVESSTRL